MPGLLEPLLSSRLMYTQLCRYVGPVQAQAQAQAFENKTEKEKEAQLEETRLRFLGVLDFEEKTEEEKQKIEKETIENMKKEKFEYMQKIVHLVNEQKEKI